MFNLEKIPYHLKGIFAIILSILASYLLGFKMNVYFSSCILCWFSYMILHVVGTIMGVPFVKDSKHLTGIGVACFFPILNMLNGVFILIMIITRRSPEAFKALIRDLQ